MIETEGKTCKDISQTTPLLHLQNLSTITVSSQKYHNWTNHTKVENFNRTLEYSTM